MLMLDDRSGSVLNKCRVSLGVERMSWKETEVLAAPYHNVLNVTNDI